MRIRPFSIDDGFSENLGDLVVVCVERFDSGPRVKAEQVDFIIDSRDSEGALGHKSATGRDTALTHEEALLGLKIQG